MSKNPIRKDKTCLNCNHVVDLRFCPNCGQENTNTRKTFHHLFIHFFEDLTHYENAFWKTIRNLLIRPASLTKEYLSGKRLSYLAPVRLYIFISFITFFLIKVFPNDGYSNLITINETKSPEKTTEKDSLKTPQEIKIEELKKNGAITDTQADSLKYYLDSNKKNKKKSLNLAINLLKKWILYVK